MPIYPINKTYRSGFYNNHKIEGRNDREYSAKDMRIPFRTVFSDGVLASEDGTAGDNLKVTLANDSSISIASGYAQLNGAWFINKSEYIIGLDIADDVDRYDCVIIRNDDTETETDDVRDSSIYIKSLSHIPTISDLERTENVYEICIAYVKVEAFATYLTSQNIVDTRIDGELCDVMSGIGAMVVRTYNNTYFSETINQTKIPIGIPQYNRARDILLVIVEGRNFTQGENYTIDSNEFVTLNIGLPLVNTKIEFSVLKNVNAAGGETVVQEVAALRVEMNANNKKLEHHYYCNGSTDNIAISQIAQDYLNGGTDYGSMRLMVHGTLGASMPYSGEGTSSRNYFWFALGKDGESVNRKLIVDFTDCRAVSLPINSRTYNTVFSGNDVNVIGANIIASNSNTGTYIRMFSSSSGAVYAEDCRFWITANITSYISQTGTFVRCRGSVTTHGGSGYCFYPTANALLRLHGGEYYAYATNSYTGTVVYQTHATAVSILYGVNCPSVARNGFVQSNAALVSGGSCSLTDTITTLTINAPNANIRGTLAQNKPNMM